MKIIFPPRLKKLLSDKKKQKSVFFGNFSTARQRNSIFVTYEFSHSADVSIVIAHSNVRWKIRENLESFFFHNLFQGWPSKAKYKTHSGMIYTRECRECFYSRVEENSFVQNSLWLNLAFRWNVGCFSFVCWGWSSFSSAFNEEAATCCNASKLSFVHFPWSDFVNKSFLRRMRESKK